MRRNFVGSTIGSAFLAFAVFCSGCSKSGTAGNSASSAKPSDHSATQLTELTTSERAAELADSRKLVGVLDLSTLPVPDGAVIADHSGTQMHLSAQLLAPMAIEFYAGKLELLGWNRDGPATAESVSDSFAQLNVVKDGYRLKVTAVSNNPTSSSITIEHIGNLDTRTLPRVEKAEDQYSCATSSLYFSPMKVADAVAALRKLLAADGWQEYVMAHTEVAVRPEAADMLFRKKAYSLAVSISKPVDEPNKCAIQYCVSTLAHDAPAPPDAQQIEIQDSRWLMMCVVPRDMAATAAYYRAAMPEIGFSAPPIETSADKSLTLAFQSASHDLIVVNFKPAGDKTTRVNAQGYTSSFREMLKKAEAVSRAKHEADEKAIQEAKAERAKELRAGSKRLDDTVDSAISDALRNAAQAAKGSDTSKEIPDEAQSKLDDVLKRVQANDPDALPDKPKTSASLAATTSATKTLAGLGGAASGQLKVGANVRALSHAYAYEISGSGKVKTIVVFSDIALAGADLRDDDGLRKLAEEGKLHGLQTMLGDRSEGDGKKTISTDVFDEAVGGRLTLLYDRLDDQKVDDKTISGRLHLDSPRTSGKGVAIDYDVKFAAPIER